MRVSLSRKTPVEPGSRQPECLDYCRGKSRLIYRHNHSFTYIGNTASLPSRQLPCEP